MKVKKHCIMAAAVLAAASWQAVAQTPVLSQDFEGADFPPAGWTVLDSDGDDNTWLQQGGNQYVNQYTGSSKLAVSYTRNPANYSAYGAQDNWLITPPVAITNAKYIVQFVYAAQDLDKTEPLSLLVSEGGVAASDFVEIWSTTVDNGYDDDIVWSQAKRSLADYEGKTIRVALRHKANGSYGLSIDNFYILNQGGPLQPTGFSLSAATDGRKEITLSWTNPSKNAVGDNLSDLSIVVYRDGEYLTELTGRTPGAADSYVDTTDDGTHTYAIAAKNSEGEGLKTAARSIYLGEDIPKPVTETVALTLPDGTVALSWLAPTKGANNGFINLDALRYVVYRNGEELARDLAVCRFTDTAPNQGSNEYTVAAVSGGGESAIDAHASAYVADPAVVDVMIDQTAERDNTLARIPIDLYTNYSVSQTIYTPEDFNFLTGEITDIVYKGYHGTDSPFTGTGRIYITSTDLTELTNWAPLGEADKMFDGSFTITQGANDLVFHLDTPFEYTGGNIVVTAIKDNKGYAGYTDRFYSVKTAAENRTFTTSTYDPVEIASLPHSTYSDKKLAERPSTRFLMTPKGVATLSGVVTTGADNTPVTNVTVSADGYEGLTATTDAEGRYTFRFIPVSVTSVTFSKVGYENATATVALAEGSAATADINLSRLPNFTLSGKVTTEDTGLNASGAIVELGGYEALSTTVAADGRWSIDGVYSGHDYTLKVKYPIYDVYTSEFNYEGDADREYPAIVLDRALIPAWNLNAEVSENGATVTLTWNTPTSRDVEPGMKSIGDVSNMRYTGSDYYSSVYNVAHAFSEQDLASKKMLGLSVMQERVYIKGFNGASFVAKVWRGTSDNAVEVASQTIPADEISGDGSWVTVTFDTPAEIKPGSPYMIGVTAIGAGSNSCFGQASSSTIYGGNNIKWGDNPYTGNGYSPWCIEAVCAVPGTDVEITDNPDAPVCAYNVYRGLKSDDGTTSWSLLTTSPINDLTYTDSAWPAQVAGEYIYGVAAVYNKVGESAKALSDNISRAVDTDVAVTAFVSPVKSVERQETATVTVTVANFGELPVVSIPVSLTLNGEQSLSATYTGTLNKGESADLTLGEIEIAEGLNTLVAAAAVDGDEVSVNNVLTFELPNFENITLKGYRWDAYGNAGFMEFGSNNPEGADYKMEVTPNDALIISGEAVNGTFYGYTATWWGESREFVEIDPATWLVNRSIENTDDYVLDMAYDYSADKMYCLAADGADIALGTVNLTTGEVEPIALLERVMRTLACDLNGTLYSIDDNGALYTLDSTTGEATAVGETGVKPVAYLQSMAFDHNSGRLFWAHTSGAVSGDLYELSPADASATRMGTIMFQGNDPTELVGMYTDYTAPAKSFEALSTDPADGTELSEFDGVTILFAEDVTADATVLAGATFSGSAVGWSVQGNGTAEVRLLPTDDSNNPFTILFEPGMTYTLTIPQGSFVKANGDYSSEITLTLISNVSGLESVGADTTDTLRYYNLQGVEVANPVPGNIYIIRHSSGEATKQLLR